jgi:hypothetical protein
MKTAMQELIDELNELSNFYYTQSEYDTCGGINLAVEVIISKLEKEKESIERIFDMGRDETTRRFIEDGEQYYNQTYNQ